MNPQQPSRGDVPLVKAATDGAPVAAPETEGALVTALRWPVRVVVLLLVVPVRMLWDALVVCGRAVLRTVREPFVRALGWLGRALFVWPWVGLWRYVLRPVGRGVGAVAVWSYRWVLTPAGRGAVSVVRGVGAALAWLGRVLVVTPAGWLYRWLIAPVGRGVGAVAVWSYRWVLTPVGHGVAAVVRVLGVALVWLGRALFVWPWVGLWRYVLRPVGRALGVALLWTGRVLVVIPSVAVYRYVLTPVGRVLAVLVREITGAVVVCWHLAGRISRAVFGFLGRVLRLLLVAPAVWVWRHVVAPTGRLVHDHVWRPVAGVARGVGRTVRVAVAAVRATVRQARADVRRALFGGPREPAADPGARSGAGGPDRPGKGRKDRSAMVPPRKSVGR